MNLAELRSDDEKRLDFHLGNWARWMRSGEMVRGYEHGAAGCVGGGYCGDFEDMVAACDRRTAAIMDVLINDLPPAQGCAIHHQWLNAVYRYRSILAYDEALAKAHSKLLIGMDRKGLW